jgi:hypothetical protein
MNPKGPADGTTAEGTTFHESPELSLTDVLDEHVEHVWFGGWLHVDW